MMNKNKSGLPARFKAALVAPFAILVFFLFADFTLKGSSASYDSNLSGLWIKQSKDDFSSALLIQKDQISYKEGLEIHNYFLQVDASGMILSQREGAPGVNLKYETKGDELTLWWNDTKGTKYRKSKADNTLDDILEGQDLDLPYISQYRLLDEKKLFRISYGNDAGGGTSLTFNGASFTLVNLEALVNKEKGKLSKLDQKSMTAVFLIDREIPMVLVDQVRDKLRRMNALHIAEGGYPHGDLNLSPLLYNAVGLIRLLPPMDAKVLDKEEVEKNGGMVHVIDLTARNTTPKDVDQNLQKFIRDSRDGRYVISLEYDGAIAYGQYVETVDMIYKVIYSFRKDLAMEKYGAPYDQLGAELQKELRKAYPMAMSETMK